MQTGDPEQPEPSFSPTTRELLAMILLYSERTAFSESALIEMTKQLRHACRGHRPLSEEKIQEKIRKHLLNFVTEQVLRHDGASDKFIFDRRNASYLRNALPALTNLKDLPSFIGKTTIVVPPAAIGTARTAEEQI